jgi:hypothetical protein
MLKLTAPHTCPRGLRSLHIIQTTVGVVGRQQRRARTDRGALGAGTRPAPQPDWGVTPFCGLGAAGIASILRSKLITQAELGLVALEIHEIERAWGSGRPAPGLKVECGREPNSLAKPRI